MAGAPVPTDEAERLTVLRDLAILDTLPSQTFDDLTLLASEICDAPISLVSLIDEERQWFKSRVGLDAVETPRDQAFCAHTILAPDETMIVEDASDDPRFADNPLVTGDPRIRFYAGTPLRAEGQPIGTLCVIDRTPRTLSDGQRRALEALGRQVEAHLALRLAAKHLTQQQRELQRYRQTLEAEVTRAQTDATTDALTGLLNRRGLTARLDQELARCDREGTPLSVAIIDLDGFKALNDRLGHQTGDDALRGVAACIGRTQRRSDVGARPGGDEFVLVLPDTDPDAAEHAAERLRLAVRDAPWPVTASIGVATTRTGRPSAEALLGAADEALYRAKDAGRDQVASAGAGVDGARLTIDT